MNESTARPLDLVLASTSPYRRAQLERLGVPHRCRAPLCDEAAIKRGLAGLPPATLARELAIAKAESLIAEEGPGVTIIGGDQLVVLDGEVLGKPGSLDRARAQLARLAGRSHELVTALAVSRAGETLVELDVSVLTMRWLTDAEIDRYIDADKPHDCAGAYKWEERGITLFESIMTQDPSAITGLPLIALTTALRRFGHPLP